MKRFEKIRARARLEFSQPDNMEVGLGQASFNFQWNRTLEHVMQLTIDFKQETRVLHIFAPVLNPLSCCS